MSRLLSVLFVLAAAAWADDAQFAGPLLGHMFDEASQSIRPLVGTPGAAVVAPAQNASRFDKAVVAGDGTITIAYKAGGERLIWINASSREAGRVEINDSLAAFDSAALSPGATSAILYASSCKCVQILTKLRSDPKVQQTISLPDGISVQALAINDDASIFVLADASGKLRVHASGSTTELSLSTTSIAFSTDGARIGVVDNARRTVALISNLNATPELVEVASERDGFKHPIAVGFISSSKLLVADKESLVHIVDAELGGVQSVPCACVPSLIERTADASIFRVTGTGAGAVWIVQVADGNSRAMFIPVQRGDVDEGTK